MASLVLTGDTSGQVTLAAPAVAGTNTATLPVATGELSMLGTSGQTWQSLTASRALGTTYTNTTGKPILVNAQPQATTNGTSTIVVSGVTAAQSVASANLGSIVTAIVPPGATYVVDNNQASKSLISWAELR